MVHSALCKSLLLQCGFKHSVHSPKAFIKSIAMWFLSQSPKLKVSQIESAIWDGVNAFNQINYFDVFIQ